MLDLIVYKLSLTSLGSCSHPVYTHGIIIFVPLKIDDYFVMSMFYVSKRKSRVEVELYLVPAIYTSNIEVDAPPMVQSGLLTKESDIFSTHATND